MRLFLIYLLPVWVILNTQTTTGQTSTLVIEDKFGREVNEAEITLVDWEGYIANPAIQLFLRPSPSAVFPATAVLSANDPRLSFNEPSNVGDTGPSKLITFLNANPIAFHLSIWPDRDTIDDEQHLLNILFTDANNIQDSLEIDIRVIDQDIDGRKSLHGGLDQPINLAKIGNVGGRDQHLRAKPPAFFRRLFQLGTTPSRQRQVSSLFRVGQSDGPSDAPAGAGD